MPAQRDYYEVLAVTRDASSSDIKKAYRKIALKNHPDRNPGDEESTELFKEASEAYDVLSDDNKRSRYDQFGHAGVSGAGGGGGGFQDVGDIFSAFGDIFENFGFGGGGGGGARTRGRRGSSLQASAEINLTEAATGCTRELHIARHESCDTCDGSGARPGSKSATCSGNPVAGNVPSADHLPGVSRRRKVGFQPLRRLQRQRAYDAGSRP